MRQIAIQLSGSPKLYAYTATAEQMVNRSVGDRVVIPNKVKEDGTLSLSIGVWAGYPDVDAPEGTLKPIVQFIDATALRVAQLEVLKLESKGGVAA